MIKFIKNFFYKPQVWFTSDLHFGHKNVINYCNRPWLTVDEMHAGIIKIWNKTVHPKDIVYVLGDFSLNPKWSREIIPKLNGHKRLIAGNHDACFPNKLGQGDRKTEKMREKYLEHGWELVLLNGTMTWIQGRIVYLNHFPFDTEYDARYKECRPQDNGSWLLHRHLHSCCRTKGRQIDVGFDGDHKLWNEKDIIKLMDDERTFIPSPLTEFYKTRKDDDREGM